MHFQAASNVLCTGCVHFMECAMKTQPVNMTIKCTSLVSHQRYVCVTSVSNLSADCCKSHLTNHRKTNDF